MADLLVQDVGPRVSLVPSYTAISPAGSASHDLITSSGPPVVIWTRAARLLLHVKCTSGSCTVSFRWEDEAADIPNASWSIASGQELFCGLLHDPVFLRLVNGELVRVQLTVRYSGTASLNVAAINTLAGVAGVA